MKAEVLVVGAGPAGLSAAISAAKGGKKVVIIDKKEEIGKPVQCAEGIGSYLLEYLPFEFPKEFIEAKISGMYFWTEEKEIKKVGSIYEGYTINREKFEKWLAKKAENYGAKILLKNEFNGLEEGDDYIEAWSDKENFRAEKLIAADGAESGVLKSLRLFKEECIAKVINFEMKNVDLRFKDMEQVFITELAPLGYGFIFPLSGRRANIGLGTADRNIDLEKNFEEFLEIPVIKKQIKNAEIVKDKSGSVTIDYHVNGFTVGDKILLAGDCANQNLKPFAEGILPAVICGYIAGDAISMNKDYKKLVYEHMGDLIRYSDKINLFVKKVYELGVESRNNVILEILSNIASLDDILLNILIEETDILESEK